MSERPNSSKGNGNVTHAGSDGFPLGDPRAVEELGTGLAKQAAGVDAGIVLAWHPDMDDMVLAHIVARELGLPLALATQSAGILELEGAALDGKPVLLIAGSQSPTHNLAPAVNLLAAQESDLAGVLALHGTLTGLPEQVQILHREH